MILMNTKQKSKWHCLHAGDGPNGKKLWHKWDSDDGYWSGSWHHRTPEQLLHECETTIKDLLINHPELQNKQHTINEDL
jgi:hypothetical protein